MTSTSPARPTALRVDVEQIAALAEPVVASIVWATATTVGPDDRPRSRIVHPVLEWSPTPHGWITSRPTPLKRRHLATHPYVTLSYWSPAQDCVYVDCDARWADPVAAEQAWGRIASAPPPVGFDPATIWPDGPDAADFAVIELQARRVRVVLAAARAAGEPAPLWVADPA
ncbi:MAG: pyridoxamine 5'-phosphate oxidase family protein [Microthrixaceae bacterium]